MPENPDHPFAAHFDPDRYDLRRSEIAVVMGRFFLRYLSLVYRQFEGDFLLPIVLGEIAHHNVFHLFSPTGEKIETPQPLERMKKFQPTNAFSISQATGIPRETVRRKIEKLAKKGWIVKNPRGEVFLSESVADHFAQDFNKDILAELLKAADCIRNLLSHDS
ncbi:MAG: hypothetical protein ACLFRG_11320 [Desulfococcaceae bacterium]